MPFPAEVTCRAQGWGLLCAVVQDHQHYAAVVLLSSLVHETSALTISCVTELACFKQNQLICCTALLCCFTW